MATFTLDNLKAEVERKYAPTVIENGDDEYILANLLQLPSKTRSEVLSLIDKVDGDEESASGIEEQLELFTEIVKLSEKNGRGDELLELIGDNTALIFEIVSAWMETTQVGEAEGSSES